MTEEGECVLLSQLDTIPITIRINLAGTNIHVDEISVAHDGASHVVLPAVIREFIEGVGNRWIPIVFRFISRGVCFLAGVEV